MQCGEFQPLSYWAQLGYDAEKIQANTHPRDIKEHRQLGTTYRVVIEKDSKALVETILRMQQLAKSKPGGTASAHGKNNEPKS